MLRRTFLKILAAIFPVSAAAAAIPASKSYLHGYRLKQLEILPVPSTTQQLYDSMNRILGFGPSTQIYWSVTGEPYIEYAVATPAGEGAEQRLCRWTWNVFRKQVLLLPDAGQARVYWRIKPKISIFDAGETFDLNYRGPHEQIWRACIYLRYLISERPVLVDSDSDPEGALLRMAGKRRSRYTQLRVEAI